VVPEGWTRRKVASKQGFIRKFRMKYRRLHANSCISMAVLTSGSGTIYASYDESIVMELRVIVFHPLGSCSANEGFHLFFRFGQLSATQ
jgi:hypothetical protein